MEDDDVPLQQHRDRVPEPADAVGVHPHHRQRAVAGAELLDVRFILADAAPGGGLRDAARLARGISRRLLQRGVGALGLPSRHALPRGGPPRHHRLRHRRHRPRRRSPCPGTRVP